MKLRLKASASVTLSKPCLYGLILYAVIHGIASVPLSNAPDSVVGHTAIAEHPKPG